MNIPFLDALTKGFDMEIEMPKRDSLDQYLDAVLPKIRMHSEDLREKTYFQDIRWKEVRDDEKFMEAVLHIFRDGGEYMLVIDGNIVKGSWKQLGGNNTLILEIAGRNELFDLVFLNGVFFVLKKHGDQERKGFRKYHMFVNERASMAPGGRPLEWREMMERLFNIHRENNSPMSIILAAIVLVIAVVLYFSLR